MTYHYGAICFGALVVAPIEAIATSINSMKRASARAESGAMSSVLSGCLCCITTVLQCCESILDYFNKFAFCLVGMRGASYAYASRQVVALFGTQGCIAAGADFYAESVGCLVEHRRWRGDGGLRRRDWGTTVVSWRPESQTRRPSSPCWRAPGATASRPRPSRSSRPRGRPRSSVPRGPQRAKTEPRGRLRPALGRLALAGKEVATVPRPCRSRRPTTGPPQAPAHCTGSRSRLVGGARCG